MFSVYLIVIVLIIGQMEDIQRVTGLGIENDFHEEYDDDGYDQSDLEDEFGYNTELDDVVVPTTVNRYPNGKVSVAPEISSDEPMDDYQSSDANNDSHRGRLMPKSANRQGPNARRKSLHASGSPLESLRQSDEYEEELSAEYSKPPCFRRFQSCLPLLSRGPIPAHSTIYPQTKQRSIDFENALLGRKSRWSNEELA